MMTIMSSPTQRFTCDLVDESKKHVTFLETLHLHSISITKPSNDTLRRYSELWLPLVYRHSLDQQEGNTQTQDLIPPADIAWLWHCHRLAPYRYAKHIQNTFDHDGSSGSRSTDLVVLDPGHPFVVQLEDNVGDQNPTFDADKHSRSAEYTKDLWTQMYPTEPFLYDFARKEGEELKEPSEVAQRKVDSRLSGFDVIESCERQGRFLWQVSQGSFQNASFLEEGVENYYNFMKLIKKKEDRPRFLVPTYQIDLMWHTHILASIKSYHRDCMEIIQTILEHDDSLTDRSDGGILDTNFRATKALWKNVYGKEYKVPGGMYRGEPPKDYFDGNWAAGLGSEKASSFDAVLLAGVSLLHLIGEVGASSHGRDDGCAKKVLKRIFQIHRGRTTLERSF